LRNTSDEDNDIVMMRNRLVAAPCGFRA
jgi:hypothetical protein